MKLTVEVENESQLAKFLDKLENRLEAVEEEYGETLWRKYLREPSGDLNEIELKRSEIILNKRYFDVVKRWKTKTSTPGLKKRLASLERLFLRRRVEALQDVFSVRNKLYEKHIAFKPSVQGKRMDRAEVDEILRRESDSLKRKAAWEAPSEHAQKVEAEVVELMKLRNKHAGELGYETYADYSLTQSLIDKTELLSLYEELDKLTAPLFRAVLEEAKRKTNITKPEPWDIDYLMNQFVKPPDKHFPKEGLIPKIHGLLKSIGLDHTQLPIEVRVADIPFGGICFPIKIPSDIRIVYNPKDGHRFYKTLFHEFGHALHGCFIDQPSYSLKVETGCFAEGMARILEHFSSDYTWIRANTPLSEEETTRFVKAQKASRLYRIRNLMGISRFEYGAYAKPGQDLNKLLSSERAKHVFVSENDTPIWAALAFFTTHPIYIQNYVLAEVIATQTLEYLETLYGEQLNTPKVSEFLIEKYYSPGGSVDWKEKIKAATGSKLNVEALARYLQFEP